MKNIYVLFALAFSFITVSAQTTVPAIISSNQVWTPAGSPYVVNQNTYIGTGVSVKIMPGTRVVGDASGVKIIVDGELQVLGNSDSLVIIDTLGFDYTKDCVQYDSATGDGATVRYAQMTGTTSTFYAIDIAEAAILIDHCYFYDYLYSVFASVYSTNPLISITNCLTQDVNSSSGNKIRQQGPRGIWVIENNVFNGYQNHLLGGDLTLNNNVFNGVTNSSSIGGSIDITPEAYLEMHCNTFNNVGMVEVDIYSVDTPNAQINITHNTFEGGGSSNSNFYAMFRLSLDRYRGNINSKANVNYNNFLTANTGSLKVLISGYNSTPATKDTINFRNNYWQSTLASDIDTMIKDYTDDITILGLVDYSNALSAKVTTCPLSHCNADFTTSVDGLEVDFINASTTTHNDVSYYWDFGNGYSSTSENPNQTYATGGSYTVCLKMYDDSSRLCDSICKTIFLMECDSMEIGYTQDCDSVYFTCNVPGGPVYQWRFGDGSSATSQNPSHAYANVANGTFQACLTVYDPVTGVDCEKCMNVVIDRLDASFYFAQDTSNPFNIYLVNNSNIPDTANTSYYWDFGDGGSSASVSPTHWYQNFGLYEICMTLTDLSGCTSTHCDSIGLDSSGNILKVNGFTVNVIDEDDLKTSINPIFINGLNVYPNPSAGNVHIDFKLERPEMLEVEIVNAMGVAVMQKNVPTTVGENSMELKLNEYENGLYFIRLKAANQVTTVRVVVMK